MISGIGNSSQLSSKLFSALDTKSKGFLEKSDFTSAFSKLSSTSGTSGSSSVDDLFSALDSDSNGQVTESEFSSTLAKLQEQLDSQFNQMRMHGGPQGAGSRPPPPPANDAGLSKEELTAKIEEIGSSNSKLSNSLSNIANNFEAADTNSDGKVSLTEAMAYDQSSKSSSATESSTGTASASTSASDNGEAKIMMKIMQLMHAYTQQDQSSNAVSSLLSVSA